MKAAILGTGSWGTAFGHHLADRWDEVTLWGVEPAHVAAINETRTNPDYFGDMKMPAAMNATLDLDEAVAGADAVFVVVPSQVVREVGARLRTGSLGAGVPVICLSKGYEVSSLKRLSVVLHEELNADRDERPNPVAVLLGPSHAEEVIRRLPTAVVLAGRGHGELWHHWQHRIAGPSFRVYTNHDLVGVEFASAFKNVLAIASGMCDGLGFGDNTRGAVLTRGLAELSRLGMVLGGSLETLYGLAGIGDMITTCTSSHSRNRNFGEAVARAKTDPREVLAGAKQVVEGVEMTRAALKLSAKHSIELPITQEVHHVLFSGKAPLEAIQDLMLRAPRSETELGDSGR